MGNFRRLICLITASLLFAGCAKGIDKKDKALAAPATTSSGSELLASYHFIGTTNLAKANATNLQHILSVPAGVDFREQIFHKLAAAPGQLLAKRVKSNADQSALLRPLLYDLFGCESLAELRRNADGSQELVFAIRLNEKQSKLWQENLSKVAQEWTGSAPRSFEVQKFRAWEVKWKSSPRLIWLVEAQEWLLIGAGDGKLALTESWITSLKEKGLSPLAKDHLLETTIDWPKMEKWFPSSPFKLARTEITVKGNGETLRATGRAVYPQNLNWKSSPWQIPMELVRDPIVSFTAAQNLAAVVKEPATLQKLSVRPLTNQLFLWAQAGSPFHSSAAVPAVDATNALSKMGKELPATFNNDLQRENNGSISVATNGQNLIWKGLSLLMPELRATNGYLLATLFPPLPLKTLLPEELLGQIRGRTNLVYYDWEITQNRMGQWQLLSEIIPPLKPNRLSGPGIPASKKATPPKASGTNALSASKTTATRYAWQSAIGPQLGNAITEVTQTGPNELSLLRKSYIGLTGFELVLLSRWLSDPEFPLFGYQLPAEKK